MPTKDCIKGRVNGKFFNSVLVVTAHPDDKVLGCDGAIASHKKAGDTVRKLILAEGITSHQEKRDREGLDNELSYLKKAAILADKILGVENTNLLKLPGNRLDSIDRLDLAKDIKKRIEAHQPNTIYVNGSGD